MLLESNFQTADVLECLRSIEQQQSRVVRAWDSKHHRGLEAVPHGEHGMHSAPLICTYDIQRSASTLTGRMSLSRGYTDPKAWRRPGSVPAR